MVSIYGGASRGPCKEEACKDTAAFWLTHNMACTPPSPPLHPPRPTSTRECSHVAVLRRTQAQGGISQRSRGGQGPAGAAAAGAERQGRSILLQPRALLCQAVMA